MISVSCPVCGQRMQGEGVAEWPCYPFCSARCRTIDLGRWLGETYRLPAEDSEDAPAPESPDTL
jgi:endogenous inhibitor of DNA gyrase (YacG/DUF329 family)